MDNLFPFLIIGFIVLSWLSKLITRKREEGNTPPQERSSRGSDTSRPPVPDPFQRALEGSRESQRDEEEEEEEARSFTPFQRALEGFRESQREEEEEEEARSFTPTEEPARTLEPTERESGRATWESPREKIREFLKGLEEKLPPPPAQPLPPEMMRSPAPPVAQPRTLRARSGRIGSRSFSVPSKDILNACSRSKKSADTSVNWNGFVQA